MYLYNVKRSYMLLNRVTAISLFAFALADAVNQKRCFESVEFKILSLSLQYYKYVCKLACTGKKSDIQYLNGKILHGGRFCSPDQTRFACKSTSVIFTQFRRPNWVKTKKKGFAGNWSVFSSKLGEDQKK